MTAKSWSNKAATNATAVLQDAGSIFGDLAEIQARKITTDIILEKVYRLGRFEVLKHTKNHAEPFVIMELDDEIYSGYARGLGNQLLQMIEGAKGEVENEAFSNERKSWTEIEVGLPVLFVAKVSPAGTYRVMEIYEPEAVFQTDAATLADKVADKDSTKAKQ